jgi:hypothetical protein
VEKNIKESGDKIDVAEKEKIEAGIAKAKKAIGRRYPVNRSKDVDYRAGFVKMR